MEKKTLYNGLEVPNSNNEIFDAMFQEHINEYEDEIDVDSDVDECEEDDYTEEDEE